MTKVSKCLEVIVHKGLIFKGKLRRNKCICKFVSQLVHGIQAWALFRVNFELMTSPCRGKTSKLWENGFINELFTSKYFYFWFSSFYQNWNIWNSINLDLFDPFLGSSRGVKTSKLWDSGLKNQYFTSNFPLLLTFIFVLPLVGGIEF